MPPDRGRASKACTACHKQKTRCYSSGSSGGPCLRCERLQQSCSLKVSSSQRRLEPGTSDVNDGLSSDDRLSRLEGIVQAVVERLDNIAPRVESSTTSASLSSPADQLARDTSGPSFAHPVFARTVVGDVRPEIDSAVDSTAPVYAIRDVAAEVGAGQHDRRVVNGSSDVLSPDIINIGLLSPQDASSLLALALWPLGCIQRDYFTRTTIDGTTALEPEGKHYLTLSKFRRVGVYWIRIMSQISKPVWLLKSTSIGLFTSVVPLQQSATPSIPLKSRSAAVRESLLSEMVRLSAAILTLAMETADVRTRHLSDHIYHIITFAAVTLCRLLHMYENELARTHDIAELDQLVLTLVTWLHSIGLPCHVSHTLGDVVSAFHEKLRPNARPTPSYVEAELPWGQDDLAFTFPDQLGTELFYSGNNIFFPDWEPLIQGPPT
ncbi:hypothetical protein G7Y89_g10628 [Cudoniella acicularis]|uniref:Transcriptional activator of proteases prtT n=1 Tax=Cudoniella acicularis TaxID=354080 RepID=A0A8H4RCD4_9HELO|nr:hypothetical protein G7Y89_g10628 [Cudoniella acicularis]